MRSIIRSAFAILAVALVAGIVGFSAQQEPTTLHADCTTSYDWCD